MFLHLMVWLVKSSTSTLISGCRREVLCNLARKRQLARDEAPRTRAALPPRPAKYGSRMPVTRTAQIPRMQVRGGTKPPPVHGNAWLSTASKVIDPMERTDKAQMLRGNGIAAETAAGAIKRNENGFSRPPVR